MLKSLNKGIKLPKRAKHAKKKGEGSAIGFIFLTISSFALMIGYVWLNNEVTATLNDISILSKELSKNRTALKICAQTLNIEWSNNKKKAVRLAARVNEKTINRYDKGR